MENVIIAVIALAIVVLVGLVINMWFRLKKANYNLGIERAHGSLYERMYKDLKQAITDTFVENKHKGVLVAGMKKIMAATKSL